MQHPGRNACQHGTGLVAAFCDHRTGTDAHMVGNGHTADDLGSCANVHMAAQHRGGIGKTVTSDAGLPVEHAVRPQFGIAGNDNGAVVPDFQPPAAGPGVDLQPQPGA